MSYLCTSERGVSLSQKDFTRRRFMYGVQSDVYHSGGGVFLRNQTLRGGLHLSPFLKLLRGGVFRAFYGANTHFF